MSSKCIVVLLLLSVVARLQACGGNVDMNYVMDHETIHKEENESLEMLNEWLSRNTSKSRLRDPLTGNMWHHGWTPNPEEMAQWKTWLNNYKEQFNESVINIADPDKIHEFDSEHGPGSGWPKRWSDLGEGFGGAAPPPWAYAPKNTGKSSYCFLPPRVGRCSPPEGLDPAIYTSPAPSLRFAYNPYKDECVPFTFSGCSGNRNNFHTKLACEQSCVAPVPFNGCDPESHIYIDDVIPYK